MKIIKNAIIFLICKKIIAFFHCFSTTLSSDYHLKYHHMPVSFPKGILIIQLLLFSMVVGAQSHAHYYIVFSARDASIRPFSVGGHAIISWGYSHDSLLVCSKKSLGFYPGEGRTKIEATLKSRRGRLERGYFANGKGLFMDQMVIEVDSAVWNDTQAEAESWDYKTYNFFTRNCLHFMDKAAAMASLKCPRPHTFLLRMPLKPVKYLRRLQRKNKKRIIFFDEMQFDLSN